MAFMALFAEQGERLRETESWRRGAARGAQWGRGEQTGAPFISEARRWRRGARWPAGQRASRRPLMAFGLVGGVAERRRDSRQHYRGRDASGRGRAVRGMRGHKGGAAACGTGEGHA